jgi:SAM-dependent methyltransferase
MSPLTPRRSRSKRGPSTSLCCRWSITSWHRPGPAVTEFHRVVRPGGWVLVRTPTRELLDRVEFLTFCPEARAVDDGRMPPRGSITETFVQAGFVAHAWRIVEQEFAATPLEALERVHRRAFSSLRLISDEAFAAGPGALGVSLPHRPFDPSV